MIPDLELRALFKAEGEEHLQTLESGLLRLEEQPRDEATLEQLFRSAHNLKGAARMLGLRDLETLAHHFEDELGAARRGHKVVSPAIIKRLYCGLDTMGQLVREAGGGAAAQLDIAPVLAHLRGEAPPVEPPLPIGAGEAVANCSLPWSAEGQEVRAGVPGESQDIAASGSFTIDTIRVEPQKLDALMTLAGELAVTTTRLARALATCDDLVTLSEEWSRDAATISGSTAARFHDRELRRLERMGLLIGHLARTGDEEITRLGLVADQFDEAVRGMRLLPFSTLFNLFPRLVRELSHEQNKEVRLVVEGGSITADKHLLEELKDPLMHLIRNAIDHGLEPPEERLLQGKPPVATLRLRAYQTAANVIVEITDDGRGLDEAAIGRAAARQRSANTDSKATPGLDGDSPTLTPSQVQTLVFSPGFSTSNLVTDVSGRGVGLDVVRSNIERLKGTVTVESVPGSGCTFRLQAPITLATTRVLLVRVGQWSYALPMESVQETTLVDPQDVFSIEGRPMLNRDGRPVGVARLADLLELPAKPAIQLQPGVAGASADARRSPDFGRPDSAPCIMLNHEQEWLGLFVDALIDEQEVLLKPFGALLQRVRNVSAATILSSGEICMVLNPRDLIETARKQRPVAVQPRADEAALARKAILLAEDSITTRTQMKRILESAGYEVVTAVDGADAFKKLGTRLFDAVVSDIEMPNMDGLTLAASIRQDAIYRELPIILVTSLATDHDRQRGSEVGANAYLTKGAFEQNVLLDALRRLV